MNGLIAQTENPIGSDPITGIGDIGLTGTDDAVTIMARLLSTVIGLLTIIAALYFMFMVITGAISIISSAGDKGAYQEARKRITTGAIGFVAVIAAIFIMDLIAVLLGIPDILNLQEMINRIRL